MNNTSLAFFTKPLTEPTRYNRGMTAQELLREQMEESGRMLRRTFEDLDGTAADFRHANLMSPAEQVRHLCACYRAAADIAQGRDATWPEYGVQADNWEDLREQFEQLRSRAVEACSGPDDVHLKTATEYVILHEQYHVGQLCAIRLAIDPAWDPYTIYT